MTASYCGRFAPSPTGPLHQGSLVAALASFLDARARGGRWLVRIEDLDPLRETPQAAHQILDSLQAHGLAWDGDVLFQSSRHSAYEGTLARLRESGRIYPCPCSRAELRAQGGRHPRRCRDNPDWTCASPHALRFAVESGHLQWRDELQGPCHQDLTGEIDDFVVRRKEGFYAYQLAVVCDDIHQGVTHVVRGSDLLDSTPLQLALYAALNREPPRFLHLPVVVGASGQKLSKQNQAPPLDDQRAGLNLAQALTLLRHPPPATLRNAPPGELLDWAIAHWSVRNLPPVKALPACGTPSSGADFQG